jgi:hypothetical protein
MIAEEVRATLKQQPFEVFRLVMTDGASYEIRHPDLLLVGRRTLVVGLVGDAAQEYFERSVKVDLAHVVHLEPIGTQASGKTGG